MTLIASFSIGEYPFLLGDLLISGPERDGQSVRLPSIGDAAQVFPKGTGFVPTRLRRKVCHFGNLAVAWSGRYIAAKAIVKALFENMESSGPFTQSDLDSALRNIDQWLLKNLEDGEVCLLGYLIDPDGSNSVGFGANYSDISSSFLANARIAGSGRSLFQEYFDHQAESALELLPHTETGSFEEAMSSALAVTGMLLQLEMGTHRTLRDYFGGGYEVISLKGRRFILADDLLYAFWFARVADEGVTISPLMRFFKQTYHQDVMVVRTLEMKSPDVDNPMFLTEREDEVHYLPPIYRELAQKEMSAIPIPDLSAFMLCSYVLVESPSGIEVLTKFDWSKAREIPLRFVDDGDLLVTQIQREYIEGIFSAIEARY